MFAPDMSSTEMGGYPGPGALTDIADHPAMMMPEPGHSPAAQHSTQMAGDVLPIPGELSAGSGQDSRAVDYATGSKKEPKVLSIGHDTLRGWAKRTQDRLK